MAETDTQQPQVKMRPPVVVVLGHVDHGKTKLLDTIRKTKIAEGESGGITQHIGAYQARVRDRLITFLDTPGHEAFSAIRARGAKVADVAVLVVAADEGVKPQTKEAIDIIKKEDIPFVVAINKIDREAANPQKVRQDLAGHGVLVEGWGGTVPVVEISAKQGQNIDELLDMVLLVADLEDLREELGGSARGVVIESHLDRQRGYTTTVLIRSGILRVGDWVVAGTVMGKIKAMLDFKDSPLSEAHPSQPAQVIGCASAPDVGVEFVSVASKEEAQELSRHNIDLTPLLKFFTAPVVGEGELKKSKDKILNLIFKSDVSSSLEAIDSALKTIRSDEVGYAVISYGTGNINATDVQLAETSRAALFGFRVSADDSIRKLAELRHIPIRTFDIIYELVNAVRDEMTNLLGVEIKRVLLGRLRILGVFKKDTRAQVVGGRVISGLVERGVMVDVVRGGDMIKVGKLVQLQHNKQDVTEVREGLDAGLKIENSKDASELKEGDVLEIYREENIKRSL